MSNPFKKGDKVIARGLIDGVFAAPGTVFVVDTVRGDHVDLETTTAFRKASGPKSWHYTHLVAAVTGQDYPHCKFRVGDKVIIAEVPRLAHRIVTVTKVDPVKGLVWTDNCLLPDAPWEAKHLRHWTGRVEATTDATFREPVAVSAQPAAGQPLGTEWYAPNTGHLPDGSSVQKHSAGPLYPCVIAMRDGKLGGKYDYGVLSPRNQEPLWLSTHEAAVELAQIIKKDLT